MGSRNFRRRESKKPKKDEKKAAVVVNILPQTAPVEVIKRGKKEKPEEEE
ncbi:MAG: hypothetical protein Q7T04_05700 [Dehalococcoidia bacterium]|nr:hypothetical protein [Dehalococcoidia bacterium]